MSRHLVPARPMKRQGFWYLVRRVPHEFSHLDSREMIVKSTGIRICDDPRGVAARQRVAELDGLLFQLWADLKAGSRRALPRADDRVLDAVDIGSSQTREFPSFVQISNVARADATVRSAPQKPELMVSQMVRLFAEVQIASLQRKSKNQFTKWRVERRSA